MDTEAWPDVSDVSDQEDGDVAEEDEDMEAGSGEEEAEVCVTNRDFVEVEIGILRQIFLPSSCLSCKQATVRRIVQFRTIIFIAFFGVFLRLRVRIFVFLFNFFTTLLGPGLFFRKLHPAGDAIGRQGGKACF